MTAQDVARRLPDIPVVRDRSRALAMLDAILSPEWEYRYYSFVAAWGPAQELASMRNGSGDDYAIVFSPAGAWIRVFAHESPMSPGPRSRPGPGPAYSTPSRQRSKLVSRSRRSPWMGWRW
jgi:hypothetical protein